MKRRTLPTAVAIAAAAGMLLTACGGGDDSSKANDKIAGADEGASSSPSPSASATTDKDAPTFDLPSDITVTVERKSTGDATKDAVLQDVAYSAQTRLEAFAKSDGRTANMSRYFGASAFTYWTQRVETVAKAGLTVTGTYRFFNFEVTDVANAKTAAVRYCEDQSKGYSKEIKTNKVLRTKPSNKDFILYTLQAAKDSRGDWQVTQQSWKKADASCVQG
ncbi:hypothetical protein [Streptomyces pseudovenezuelae]|uniref:Lipoprotein n=1 Tax=Streptomyces pseudovenezuelae TaxID=67350 RepID=A0ABT6LN73_9ACTN|nr:hypothetical protein [Streptomyces pseudovenezuelae]MDH6217762.1 hypothetical protein [Streptomyces pseudovenezuelae]